MIGCVHGLSNQAPGVLTWLAGSSLSGRLADCASSGPSIRAEVRTMSTEKQKEAARRNIAKAREVQSERAHGEDVPRSSEGLSTAEKDKLADKEFAFPEERKAPLTDARHVRNAISRFDQVEGVSDADRA